VHAAGYKTVKLPSKGTAKQPGSLKHRHGPFQAKPKRCGEAQFRNAGTQLRGKDKAVLRLKRNTASAANAAHK
jgi:hypothetical protein